MSRRKRRETANSTQRIKDGRDIGRFADYNPWPDIQDVTLNRFSTKRGWKTERIHRFSRRLELLYFYLLEWSGRVVDIREQYPLLPLEETHAIANSCGIRHPANPRTKYPTVITTDFVNTVRYGFSRLDEPRTVKYKAELLGPRTLEKLEIEKRYWQARNKTLKVITEHKIPIAIAENVAWFHSFRQLHNLYGLDEFTISLIGSILVNALRERPAPLRKITTHFDNQLNLEAGTCLLIVRYLLATRTLRVDMLKPINLNAPLNLIG